MAKTVFYLFFAFFVLIANHSSSQIIDCEATLKAWQNDPKWRDYAKNCTCIGVPPGQGPRCTPTGNISSFGGKTHQQIQKQIFQGLFQPMINAIFSDLFTPSNLIPNKQQEFIKDQHEEELKKHQEIAKKKAWEEWLRTQTNAEIERVREETERKRKGAEILTKTSINSGSLKIESISSNGLTPIQWSTNEAISPISFRHYPSPKTVGEQLICAAYFSKLASESVDLEALRFYSLQMDNVIQGLPTSIECKPPKELITKLDLKNSAELHKKYSEMAKITQVIIFKAEKLYEVVEKLHETENKRKEVENKIKEIDKKLEEINMKVKTADTPQKKAEADDLLAQALALRSDAEKQHNEAMELEEQLIKEKENIEREINELKNKI